MESNIINRNPIKLIVKGDLKGAPSYFLTQRGRNTKIHRTAFDGKKLDTLKLAARLYTREDALALIDFLRVHQFCLPNKNGSY